MSIEFGEYKAVYTECARDGLVKTPAQRRYEMFKYFISVTRLYIHVKAKSLQKLLKVL